MSTRHAVQASRSEATLPMRRCALCLAVSLAGAALPQVAGALELEEVVVTAQKKEQSVNDVGMSIIAFTGDDLKDLGVFDTTDMAALTPGLTYTSSQFGPPTYTMRGVGYRDTSYNGASTVGVYVDEAAIAYPIMTIGAAFDLERTEVLKGPQGTLYGRNNTGGAINYIANKPTEEFEAGISGSYSRYETVDVEAYLSGAVSDSVRARLAVKTTQSGEGWQKNRVNDEKLGEQDKSAVRFSLDADLSDDFHALLQLGWWEDRSEPQAAQIMYGEYQSAGNQPVIDIIAPWQERFSNTGKDADVAGWDFGQKLQNEFTNTSATLRLNYALNDSMSITTVTSLANFEDDGGTKDIDGFSVPFADGAALLSLNDLLGINGGNPFNFANEQDNPWLSNFLIVNEAEIDTFSQEIRLEAEYDDLSWIAGLYYADETVDSRVHQITNLTTNTNFGPGVNFNGGWQDGESKVETFGVFVHNEWQISEAFRLTAGLRYSDDTAEYTACTRDSGDGTTSTVFGALLGLPAQGQPFECLTVVWDENGPTDQLGLYDGKLKEDSWSGRVNLDWYATPDAMFYASISRGFKAGSFPNLIATQGKQFEPVVQEELIAYEAGIKTTLLDGAMQFNAAVYYSDYTDKQLMGTLVDPVFGTFRKLVNIPESEVQGMELDIKWQATDGLFLSLSAAYMDSEVKGDFIGPDWDGKDINYGGSTFPFTADLQITGLVDYTWSINDKFNAFVGADFSYTDDINTLYEPGRVIDGVDPAGLTAIPDEFVIDAYTTVNARIGVLSNDDKWRVMLWSRNITDEFYTTSVINTLDSVIRFTGMPRTYGMTFEYRYF